MAVDVVTVGGGGVVGGTLLQYASCQLMYVMILLLKGMYELIIGTDALCFLTTSTLYFLTAHALDLLAIAYIDPFLTITMLMTLLGCQFTILRLEESVLFLELLHGLV